MILTEAEIRKEMESEGKQERLRLKYIKKKTRNKTTRRRRAFKKTQNGAKDKVSYRPNVQSYNTEWDDI